MKKVLVLVAVLALVGSASANVEIFFTSSAQGFGVLAPPGGPLDPTASPVYNQGTDALDGYTGMWAPPVGAATIDLDAGEFGLMWVRFNGEPNFKKIQGLDLVIGGTATASDVAYYVLDNSFYDGSKRWDGVYTPPGDPQFKNLPEQVLVAVTAYGIQNQIANNADKLYQGGATRTALLGAVTWSGTGEAAMSLGPLGISYGGGGSPTVDFYGATIIPEPASMLLIGLAGLFLRRR